MVVENRLVVTGSGGRMRATFVAMEQFCLFTVLVVTQIYTCD